MINYCKWYIPEGSHLGVNHSNGYNTLCSYENKIGCIGFAKNTAFPNSKRLPGFYEKKGEGVCAYLQPVNVYSKCATTLTVLVDTGILCYQLYSLVKGKTSKGKSSIQLEKVKNNTGGNYIANAAPPFVDGRIAV